MLFFYFKSTFEYTCVPSKILPTNFIEISSQIIYSKGVVRTLYFFDLDVQRVHLRPKKFISLRISSIFPRKLFLKGRNALYFFAINYVSNDFLYHRHFL